MDKLRWELIPKVGITSSGIKISLGQDRAEVNKLMAKLFSPPEVGSYPDEDDFLNDDESISVRIRYTGEQITDIEFLGGSLQYQGIELHSNVTLEEVEKALIQKNLTIRDAEWLGEGKDCLELGINLATHDNVGGDGDGIEWIILSSNFE
jgi:hypothetical protein